MYRAVGLVVLREAKRAPAPREDPPRVAHPGHVQRLPTRFTYPLRTHDIYHVLPTQDTCSVCPSTTGPPQDPTSPPQEESFACSFSGHARLHVAHQGHVQSLRIHHRPGSEPTRPPQHSPTHETCSVCNSPRRPLLGQAVGCVSLRRWRWGSRVAYPRYVQGLPNRHNPASEPYTPGVGRAFGDPSPRRWLWGYASRGRWRRVAVREGGHRSELARLLMVVGLAGAMLEVARVQASSAHKPASGVDVASRFPRVPRS